MGYNSRSDVVAKVLLAMEDALEHTAASKL